MNDTRLPLLFAAISYWLVGFSTAYGLAFGAKLGAVGIWTGCPAAPPSMPCF